MKLVDLFRRKPSKEKRFHCIGAMDFHTVYTDQGNIKENFSANFYLSDDGERDVEFFYNEGLSYARRTMMSHPAYLAAMSWKKGGQLPSIVKLFDSDTTAEMLARLTEQKLTGD